MMKNMFYAALLALMFLACVFFFPRFAFGQGIKVDLVRFSTGSGKWETIFDTKVVAGTREWSWGEKVLQLKGNLLLVADWLQTREVANHPEKYSEKNFILGKHPSKGNVDLYMGASVLVYNFGSWALPQPYRNLWQGGWVGLEVSVVDGNLREMGGDFDRR